VEFAHALEKRRAGAGDKLSVCFRLLRTGCKPCSDRNEEKASEAHLISHDLWGNLSLCGWREQRVGELTLRER